MRMKGGSTAASSSTSAVTPAKFDALKFSPVRRNATSTGAGDGRVATPTGQGTTRSVGRRSWVDFNKPWKSN